MRSCKEREKPGNENQALGFVCDLGFFAIPQWTVWIFWLNRLVLTESYKICVRILM